MKKIFLLLGLLMIVSCNPFDIDNVGKPIKFGLSGGKETRASYGYSDGYKQQISWDNGDNVSIYMKWDGNNGPENADYKIIDIRSNGHIESYGKLEPLGESLKWHGYFDNGRAYEYVHEFFSSYPPRQFDGEKFLYHINSVQNGNNDIEDLYMAAYASTQNRVDYDSDATVYLEYYPMFTKLCVQIINNSDKDMNDGVLRLASSNHISGYYYVSVNGNKFEFDSFMKNDGLDVNASTVVDKNIDGIAAHSESPELVYFIANNNHNSDLYFVYNGIDYPIDAYIEGGNIYHITINVKDKTVDASPLSEAVAQMLAIAIRHWINDQNGIANLLQDLYDVNPPEGKGNWFNNNIWNEFCNYTNDENGLKQINYDKLVEIFKSKEAVEKLFEYVQQKSYEKDVNITASPKICTSLTGTELSSLFPGATSIYIQISQNNVDIKNPIHIDVEGFLYLKTITIEYAQSVRFKDCPELTSATIRNKASNYKGYTVENCPNLSVYE